MKSNFNTKMNCLKRAKPGDTIILAGGQRCIVLSPVIDSAIVTNNARLWVDKSVIDQYVAIVKRCVDP